MDYLDTDLYLNSLGVTSTETLCRICSSSNDYLIPLFSGEGKEHRLNDKINKYLPIKVTENDKLPTKICYQCASTLLAWSDLVDSCIQADDRLRNIRVQEVKEQEIRRKAVLEEERKNDKAVTEIDTVSVHDSSDDNSELFPEAPSDPSGLNDSENKNSSSKKRKKEAYCKCLICGRTFQFVEYLKSHLLSHSDERPYSCSICGAKFKRKDNVNHHKMTVHMKHPDVVKQREEKGRPLLTCDKCGEVKTNKQQMLLHKKKHEIHSNCEICGKSFVTPASLKEHLSKDHAEISYDCAICNQTIKSGRELYLHKQKHYTSFICDVCGKSFAVASSLRTHMVVHSDDKPFSCNECGKSFKLKVRLHLHKQSHTDVRPYACTLCEDKRFKTKTALIVHNNMHTDTRPYPCTYCPFRARKNSDLVCHIRTHTGEKPYKCDVCGRGFAQAGDMRKHRSLHDKNRVQLD